jgi:hypothetical protein
MHHIASVRANADFSLDLRFDDGKEAHLSLAEIVNSARVATPFRDPNRFVSELTLVEDGEIVRWDDQFELHADSLRYRAFPDELARDFGVQPEDRGRPAA